MANLELGVPNSPTTIFDIGSTSKQFTATSIVLLARQGKLSLDDDIRKYIPEIPAYRRPVTLRLMLHHTSGLRDYLELMDLTGVHTEDWTTDDDALAMIERQRDTNFLPGDEYLYSNTGFFLMSVVVKRVTGRTLREFAQAGIFDPLEMRHTRIHDDHTKIEPGRATGYQPHEGGGFQIDMSDFEQTGDGSVFTNVEDLQRWDENFYHPKVGDQALLDTLQTRGVLTSGQTIDYALGLVIDQHRGLRSVGHGGSWAGYRAELIRFPDQHFSVACLCNLGTAEPSDLATEVADLYLADAFPQPAPGAAKAGAEAAGSAAPGVTLTPQDLATMAGIYRKALDEEIRKVTVEGGKLKLARYGTTLDLVPLSKNVFHAASGRDLRFTFEGPGPKGARRLTETVWGGKPVTFDAITPSGLSAARLAEYAGTYRSDELQVSYDLVTDNGRLVLRAHNLPKTELTATVNDVFASDSLTLKFERDARKRVAAFALGAGRIRNIRFVRVPSPETRAGV